MILRKTFRFEASHVLPKHPGKCSRLHGHSWVLHVEIEGLINPSTGFVMDFAVLKEEINPLIDDLDHRHLGAWGHILTDVNQLELEDAHIDWRVRWLPMSFYPSSENLLIAIGRMMPKVVPWSTLTLEETCTSSASLTRKEFDEKLYQV